MILAVIGWLGRSILSTVFDALVVIAASYLGAEFIRYEPRLVEGVAFPAAVLVLLLTAWTCGWRRGAGIIWYVLLLLCADAAVVAGSLLLYDGVSLDPRFWPLDGGLFQRFDIIAFAAFALALLLTILLAAATSRRSRLSSPTPRVQSSRSRRSGGRSISYPGGGEESPGSIGQDAG